MDSQLKIPNVAASAQKLVAEPSVKCKGLMLSENFISLHVTFV